MTHSHPSRSQRPTLTRLQTDKSLQDLADVLYEEEEEAQKPTNRITNDLPPAYEKDTNPTFKIVDKKPTLVLPPGSGGEAGPSNLPNAKGPSPNVGLSKASRIIWPLALLLPLLTAGAMLYLVTCSDDGLQMSMSAVTVALPDEVFRPLWSVGQQIGRVSPTSSETMTGNTTAASGSIVSSILVKRAEGEQNTAGQLGLSTWGWCLKSAADTGSVVCSEIDGWYDLDDLLAQANIPLGSITSEAFSPVLLHGLSIHGLAMVATMASIVPVGLLIARRYVGNNPSIEAGWIQHGLLFAAAVFVSCAFVIDKLLKSKVEEHLPAYNVTAGPAPLLTLLASILLFLTLLLSSIPVAYRYFSRQKQYISSWADVENIAGPTPLPTAGTRPDTAGLGGLMRNASRRFRNGTTRRFAGSTSGGRDGRTRRRKDRAGGSGTGGDSGIGRPSRSDEEWNKGDYEVDDDEWYRRGFRSDGRKGRKGTASSGRYEYELKVRGSSEGERNKRDRKRG